MKDINLIADGKTDNSRAFAELFTAGGEVVLKEGTYLTGPIEIKNPLKLVLEKGAVIKFIPDFELYKPVFTRWEGVKCYCMHPCFYIHDTSDVTVTGEGVIDGNGEEWWKVARSKKGVQKAPQTELEKKFAALNPGYADQPEGGGGRLFQFLRPPLLQIKSSKHVTIEGITLTNSPFWTLHPLFSTDLVLKDLVIRNPYDAPNTDGIDIESCKDVHVLGCDVYVGDDGIALKSGSGSDGIKDAFPAANVLISGCKVHAAHGGAVIGSETAAGIQDIEVRDCYFDGTDRGIRIKTRRGRGGDIRNLVFRNLTMKDNLCPLVINMFYRCGCRDTSAFSLDKLPVTEVTPSIENVEITSCTATGSKASAGFLVGLPERPVKGLVIKDCHFEVDPSSTVSADESDMYVGLPEPQSKGLRLRYIDGYSLSDVRIEGADPEILIEEGVN